MESENKQMDMSGVKVELTELLNKLIKNVTNDDDSVYNKHYVGKVIEHDLDTFSDKIKILVYGVYDDVPQTAIPWAHPVFTNGSFDVPLINTLVNVTFEEDDIYRPTYSEKVSVTKGGYVGSSATTNSAKTLYDTPDNFGNLIVMSETPNSVWQKDKKTNRLNYKTADGLFLNITPNEHASGPEFDAETADVPGSFNLSIGTENDEYNLHISEKEVILSSGSSEATTRLIIDNKNIMLVAEDGVVDVGSKTNKTIFNETTTMRSTSGGQAVPDPVNMGPYCAIPICPFTGAPHVGNLFTATAAPSIPAQILEHTDLTKPDFEK